MNTGIRTFLGKCISDKNGHITLIQFPNLPLISFIIASILTRLFSQRSVHDFFKAFAYSSIITWACLEMISGANYVRRLLGLIVLVFSIVSVISFL